MNKHHEKATEIFNAYSKKNTLHFTADGQAFFDKNPAANHAKGLEDKSVVTLERHEVTETPEEEEFEELDGTELGKQQGTDEQAKEIAKNAEGKEKAEAKAK